MLHTKAPRYRTIAFVLLLLPFYLIAQNTQPEDALRQFAKYPNERIYVQFDKSEYITGETLHFKAWVFAKTALSYISTNLYVELLNKEKKSVYAAMVPLVGGAGEGSYFITKDLPEDIYYFRAYTSWQLNFNESNQYVQPVIIYNPSSSMRLKQPAATWQAIVQPESGVLLDGVESDVSVRLQSFTKLQGGWSGFLFEGNDSTNHISEFKSMNDEVGLFTITPYSGNHYNIKITAADGSSTVVALPVVQKQGVVLKAVPDEQGISFLISCKGISGQLKNYKIVAQQQGNLLYSATIPAAKEQVNGMIPLDASTKGLLHITLFDPAGNAVAERLCFANLEQCIYQQPTINYGKMSAAPKTANEWKFAADSLRSDTYVILIEDAMTNSVSSTHSLMGSYWLNDIAAPSQNTDWYFTPGNKEAAGALDALLLGEKWMPFNWNQLLNKPAATMQYFPDNYITYSGSVTQKGKPVIKEKITVLFQLKDSSRILNEVTTDSAGTFKIKSLYFFDTAKVFFHVSNNKNAAIKIDVDFKRIETFAPYKSPLPETGFSLVQRSKNDTLPQNIKNYTTALQHIQTIADGFKTMDAVVIKAKIRSKTEELDRRLSSPMFRSPGETVFDFVNEEQDLGGSTVLEWLGGRVAGVMPDGTGGVTIRGQKPAVYVDEFLDDGEPSRLTGIPYTEIAMVKIIKNSYLIGAGGTPVIAVYTKRPDMYPASELYKPHIVSKLLAGYNAVDTFRTLSYGRGMTYKTGYDTRTLIYWNPDVTTEHGTASIRFFNNDISDKLHLLVIGFTAKGIPVYLDKLVSLK